MDDVRLAALLRVLASAMYKGACDDGALVDAFNDAGDVMLDLADALEQRAEENR